MDPMMQTQLDIKRNAEEMQKYLSELSSWEKEVKRQEEKLTGVPTTNKDLPLPRNAAKKKKAQETAKEEKKRISGFDYNAWDKFNVDEACKEIDGKSTEDESESEDDYPLPTAFQPPPSISGKAPSTSGKAPATSGKPAGSSGKPASVSGKSAGGKTSAPPAKLTPKIEEINNEDADLTQLQKIDKAVFEKEQGNRFVQQEKWQEALKCYSTAIRLDPSNAIYYANRALCHLKLSNFKVAEVDSTVAIQLDKTYVKAYQRRAFARKALQQYKEAMADYEQILSLEPKNTLAKLEIEKINEFLAKAADVPKETTFNPKNMFGGKSKEAKVKKEEAKVKEEVQLEAKVKEEAKLEAKVKEEVDLEAQVKEVGAEMKKLEALSALKDQTPLFKLPEDAEYVKAISKPPHLRSKKPMQRVQIKQVDGTVSMDRLIASISSAGEKKLEAKFSPVKAKSPVVKPETVKEVARSELKTEKESSTVTTLPDVPRTYVQFESAWKSIYHDLKLRIQFLKAIPLESLPSMIGSWMESWLLCQLVETAAEIEDEQFLMKLLRALSQIERFKSLVLFWSSQDETNLNKCCSRLSKVFGKDEIDWVKTTFYL